MLNLFALIFSFLNKANAPNGILHRYMCVCVYCLLCCTLPIIVINTCKTSNRNKLSFAFHHNFNKRIILFPSVRNFVIYSNILVEHNTISICVLFCGCASTDKTGERRISYVFGVVCSECPEQKIHWRKAIL